MLALTLALLAGCATTGPHGEQSLILIDTPTEIQMGLEREGALKELDGFLAVLLWREYEQGNKAALDTLIRYNLEDVVNLQYLADAVYNQAIAKLAIRVAALPALSKHCLTIPFDSELVRYLRQAVQRVLS